ncbi:hypothetical protein GCM10023163_05590 [Aestuariibaculum suncheonense]
MFCESSFVVNELPKKNNRKHKCNFRIIGLQVMVDLYANIWIFINKIDKITNLSTKSILFVGIKLLLKRWG